MKTEKVQQIQKDLRASAMFCPARSRIRSAPSTIPRCAQPPKNGTYGHFRVTKTIFSLCHIVTLYCFLVQFLFKVHLVSHGVGDDILEAAGAPHRQHQIFGFVM